MSEMPWQAKRLQEINEDLDDLLKTKLMAIALMFVGLVLQIISFFREGLEFTFIGLGAVMVAILANLWIDSKFQKLRKEFDEVWETLPDSVKNHHRKSVIQQKNDDDIM